MDDLHEKIRRAQVRAGEQAVMDHVAKLGLRTSKRRAATREPEEQIVAEEQAGAHLRAILAERERCAAIVRAKKPPEDRLWWLRDELENLAKEIENGGT